MNQPHILYDCEAIVYLRFCHLAQFFMEPGDSYDAPINKVLPFVQSIELLKGKHNESLKVAVQGLDYYGPPLIHSLGCTSVADNCNVLSTLAGAAASGCAT
jgi:hypothetical protein